MQIGALVLALTAVVRAAVVPDPSNIALPTTTFSVTQVPAGIKPLGIHGLAAAHAKYRQSVPSLVKRAAAAATSSINTSIDAQPLLYNYEYLSPVYIGKSKLRFLLSIDTGSSDFWTFSNKQDAAQRGSHTSYPLTGQLQANQTWSIKYYDTSAAKGIVYTDQVIVGSATATAQSVEAATSVSSAFTSLGADGLLGLGPDSNNFCSPNKCQTWITTIAGQLKQNLFAVALKQGAVGRFDFGFVDPNKYVGDLTYTSVTSRIGKGTFWEFGVVAYSIGDNPYVKWNVSVLPDTGTSLILLDQEVVNAYYKQIPGAVFSAYDAGYIFDCSTVLPCFDVWTYDPATAQYLCYSVPGDYLNVNPVDNGYCYGGIQSRGAIPFNILGDVFFQANYVVFDRKGKRIGLAQQSGVS